MRSKFIRFSAIREKLAGVAADASGQIMAFGIVLFINYPLYYLIWGMTAPGGYDDLIMRLSASLLCVPLIFNRFWPKEKLHILTAYWYFTALYCLPFFFTYILLKNHGNTVWVMNCISVLFLMLLLFDIVTALSLVVIGSLLGVAFFALFSGHFIYIPGVVSFASLYATFLGAVIIGGIFSRNKQVIEQIKRRSIQAEKNSNAKTEFIANMSHDLRTPMAGLLGMLDALLYTAEDGRLALKSRAGSDSVKATQVLSDVLHKVEEYASLARESADKLNQLHNEILDNVELESGQSKEVVKEFNLDRLMQSVVALQKPVAVNKKLAFTVEIDENTPCHLLGLSQLLNRVLLNLISNALKFTEQGSVAVIVGLTDGFEDKTFASGDTVDLKIEVKDTGIGIPSDKFDEVFGQFSRLTSSYDGMYKGLGLGLYTVKKYIDTMRGTIHLASQEGQGSCFTVCLPFVIARQGTAETKPAKLTEKPDNAVTTPTESWPVLLVEDDKIAAMAARIHLTKLGCQVNWVESGEAAREKVLANNYAIIFMDIGLPNQSGIETAAEIRRFSDPHKANVPIVALTGHARGKIRQVCLHAGMQSVLSKPVTAAELKQAIDYFV